MSIIFIDYKNNYLYMYTYNVEYESCQLLHYPFQYNLQLSAGQEEGIENENAFQLLR